MFPSIFTRITEYPALERTQKDHQVQQLQIQVDEEESSISHRRKSEMESARGLQSMQLLYAMDANYHDGVFKPTCFRRNCK